MQPPSKFPLHCAEQLPEAAPPVQLPSHLPLQLPAALPLVGITAFEGLQRAGAKAGQKVLVHGGTGGVGHVAVQLARHLGADVHATCGGRQQAEIIHGYGATAIDYRTEKVADYVARHTAGAGFDVVFDTSAGPISAIHSKRPH